MQDFRRPAESEGFVNFHYKSQTEFLLTLDFSDFVTDKTIA